jgi:hypothetical protein
MKGNMKDVRCPACGTVVPVNIGWGKAMVSTEPSSSQTPGRGGVYETGFLRELTGGDVVRTVFVKHQCVEGTY